MRSMAVALLLTSALAGCSAPPPAGPTTTPKSVSTNAQAFDGKTLPDSVSGLKGTASFLERAPELTAALKNPPAPGAYFLMIAPQDIVRAVIVYAGPTLKAEDLVKKQSGPISVSGSVKKITDPAFKKMVKEKYQIDLAGNGDDVQIIMPEGEVFPAPATASPTPDAASATPVGSSTPVGK